MKEKFFRKVLKNGMTIILEKRELPIVSVAFAVRYGGVNESIEERGIAHFIEHMLYKGTPTRDSSKIAEEIERNGGILNGFTDEPLTAYWCKMPSKHLQTALDVLSDMVKNPIFDQKELEKERKVIFEEIKMYHDAPSRHVFDEIQKSLYENPLGYPLIGSEESLGKMTRETLVKKFKEVYQPNNMILCVVGNANFEKLVAFAEKNFGSGKSEIRVKKIVPKNEVKTEKRKGIDQAHFVFGHHTPLSTDKKNHAANVLNTLLADGMSSRLFKEIRIKRNLAYAVKGGSAITKNYAHSTIYVGTKKENIELVKKLVLEEFEKVSKELDEKELESIKEQMIGNYEIALEDSQNQMVNLLLHEIDDTAEKAYDFEKNIRSVKLKDVKELAKITEYSMFSLVPE